MNTFKWILITLGLMIIAYAVIASIITFLWTIYFGVLVALIVFAIITGIKLNRLWHKYFNNKEKKQ